MDANDPTHLCLKCGLCCNGVIFANGQLQAADDPQRLRQLGLALIGKGTRSGKPPRFRQPCAAFNGCTCRIYMERPEYCRSFECLLLKSAKAGKTETADALRIIRTARRRVEKVKRLLNKLGDTDETVPLGNRFRRMQKRFESEMTDKADMQSFGQLTLAIHDLNVLLSDSFYPGH